jgi:Inositol hexakisphosphate
MQAISEAISKRSGAILSAYTILKADVYPSLCSAAVPQRFDGAPNFRQAEGNTPVFGLGIPTRDGITRVLDAIGAAPGMPDHGQRCAVWTNLREEPVLYINGTPYVLREASGAYTNMKEYSGIDGQRLEELEARLKGEVLGEAAAAGGRVHVLREEMKVQVRTLCSALYSAARGMHLVCLLA